MTSVTVLALFAFAAAVLPASATWMPQPSWTAEPETGAFMPTSQALLTEDAVFFNGIDKNKDSVACGYWPSVWGGKQCRSATPGASFDKPPVRVWNASKQNFDGAFSFSTIGGSIQQQMASDVVYFYATPSLGSRKYSIPAESIVSLAPLNNTVVAVRFRRRAKGPGELQDQIQIRNLDDTFSIVYNHTFSLPDSNPGALLPDNAEMLVEMDGTLFFVLQNDSSATLYAMNAAGQQVRAPILNPCGITPQPNGGYVNIAKVPYDKLGTGEILNALIIWGRGSNNATQICRFSHSSWGAKWTKTYPQFGGLHYVTGNDGFLAISGNDYSESVNIVSVIGADRGDIMWNHTRLLSDSGSAPTVRGSEVWFQSNGKLVSRGLYFGGEKIRAAISCPRQPAVTGSRVYCVTTGANGVKQLVAFAPMTGDILWTYAINWAFAPQAIPGSDNIVTVVNEQGQVLAIDYVDVPATPPPQKNDDDDKPAVTGLVVAIVLLVIGASAAAGYLLYRRKQQGGRRSAVYLNANGDGDAAPTPKGELYGSV